MRGKVFKAISPAHRAADAKLGSLYGLEHYVAAGDIYSQPPYAGRGGWSWYTGAAAWLQRAALESICGLVLEGRIATIRPCLPPLAAGRVGHQTTGPRATRQCVP